MVTVVGMGPGHPDYVTPAARAAVEEAEVLIGGARLLELADATGKELYEVTADIASAMRTIEANKDRNVAVLVSGDPGFFSLLTTIRSHLPHLEVTVIPGISSAQVLFGRLGREWHDMAFASVHGRPIEELDEQARTCKKLCILTDGNTTAPVVARYLRERGIKGRAVVGMNLSYEDEEILDTTIDELAGMDGMGSSVLYVEI